MPVAMGDCDYIDIIIFNRIDYFIRKFVKKTPPDRIPFYRPRHRIFTNPSNCFFYFVFETDTSSRYFRFVIFGCIISFIYRKIVKKDIHHHLQIFIEHFFKWNPRCFSFPVLRTCKFLLFRKEFLDRINRINRIKWMYKFKIIILYIINKNDLISIKNFSKELFYKIL